MVVWVARRPTNEHKSVASLLLGLSGLPANSCNTAFERYTFPSVKSSPWLAQCLAALCVRVL